MKIKLILKNVTTVSLLILVLVLIQSCESGMNDISETYEYKFSQISKN